MEEVIQVADKVNFNGRIYSLEILNCVVDDAKRNGGPILGKIGMDHIDWRNGLSLSQTSHIIKDLKVKDDTLIADIEILETPEGKRLKELMKFEKMVYRMAGVGEVDENGMVLNYKLTSINAVPALSAA